MTGYLGPKTNKNTKTITWTSDFSTKGKQRACDIMNIGDNPGTPLRADAFNLLLNDQVLDLLVRETNYYIEKKLETLKSFKEHLLESSKYPYLGKTSPLEMRTLIGFMYLRGLYGLDHHKVDILFSDKAGPLIFGKNFTRERVKFLMASISFISRYECIKTFSKIDLLLAVQCWVIQCQLLQILGTHAVYDH